jgi:SAM-dependent methyltransferase
VDKSNRSFTEKYAENYRSFWEQCDRAFAHLDIDDHLVSEENLYQSWKRNFIKFFDWNNKSVVDYGIGGGYLGKMLLSEFGIRAYTGIDISERSLAQARENLRDHVGKTSFCLSPRNFADIGADIFVSLACIQHFPSEAYLVDFLENVNGSSIAELMLQIRCADQTVFNPNNPTFSCLTNYEYMARILVNYRLLYASYPAKNNYQYLVLRRKAA